MSSLLGKVGLLEDTLRRVNVRQIESRSGMARIEDGSQPDTWLQGHDHNPVHLVIDNVTDLSEIDRVDDFIIPIFLIAVQIFSLASVTCIMSAASRYRDDIQLTRVMEEERVVGAGVLHQPVHRPQDVLFRRLAHRILLIICEDNHVVSLVAKVVV